MKLSNREKMLVAVLLFIGIGYLLYTYVFTPQFKKLADIRLLLETQRQNKQNVQLQMSPNNKVFKDYKILNTKVEMMTKRLLPSILQEKLLLILEDMLAESGVSASSIAFSEPALAKPDGGGNAADANIDPEIRRIIDEINGKAGVLPAADSSQTGEGQGTEANNAAESSYNLSFMSSTISFEGSYETIMAFLKLIEGFEKKILINNINFSSTEEGNIGGSLTLDFYALPKLHEQDQAYLNWDLTNDYGKDNPFSLYSGYTVQEPITQDSAGQEQRDGEASDTAQEPYDFIMVVKPITADVPTIALGKSGSKSSNSYVYADNINNEDVDFEVTKQDGKYYYRYKTSYDSYPKDYDNNWVEFTPLGDNVVFSIISQKRNNDSDVSGANLNVINNTDKALNIIIVNEDNSRPRITISRMDGNVKVKK